MPALYQGDKGQCRLISRRALRAETAVGILFREQERSSIFKLLLHNVLGLELGQSREDVRSNINVAFIILGETPPTVRVLTLCEVG